MLATAASRIVLSPHLDDAALSLGGSIARFAAAGERILVVTVAAGSPSPDAPLSSFAASLHEAWGVGSADVVALRRREDEAAMAILGAEARRLDRLDAVYRLPQRYDAEAALLGEPALEDDLGRHLALDLAAILAASPRAVILAPLAVGGHVDHRVVHHVAFELGQRGREVCFYEDFPYAERPRAVEERLAAIGVALEPVTLDIAATLDRKVAAVLAYASQLDALFGGPEAARAAIVAYAHAVGEGSAAERTWRAPLSLANSS
jgi:LmbE family N-acetylglucosaminyl deacetylase